ncbi:hypothetical protein MKX54_18785 [Alkalihalobacillus sp. FSL R5-0424]
MKKSEVPTKKLHIYDNIIYYFLELADMMEEKYVQAGGTKRWIRIK